jgi:hypothetical protein
MVFWLWKPVGGKTKEGTAESGNTESLLLKRKKKPKWSKRQEEISTLL